MPLNALENGWKRENGMLVPDWSDGPTLPERLEDILEQNEDISDEDSGDSDRESTDSDNDSDSSHGDYSSSDDEN